MEKLEHKFSISYLPKKILFLIILLLPFQRAPTIFFENQGEDIEFIAIRLFTYLDEISFIVAMTLILWFILLKLPHYSLNLKTIPLTKPLLFLIAVCVVSTIVNRVPFLQGLWGTYDIVKNIMVVYIFSALHWSKDEFLSMINLVKKIVIFLVIVGIIAEILALCGQIGVGYLVAPEENKRFGFYRVRSLTGYGSINYLSMYALLGLFLIYTTTKSGMKKNLSLLATLCLIFLTSSRQAWIGLFMMLVLIKKRLIVPGLLIIAGIIVMSLFDTESYDPELYYRTFAYYESFRLLRENPMFGAGTGMFGGLASKIFESPIYDNWPQYYRTLVYSIGSIDTFWPVIWGETGISGLIAFSLLWFSLFRGMQNIANRFKTIGDIQMYDIGNILANYAVALVIMCFGTGLNCAFVVWTYFGLTGIYFSLCNQMQLQLKEKDA
ncbi:MAG: O-antigen ligase family protein [bacterium]